MLLLIDGAKVVKLGEMPLSFMGCRVQKIVTEVVTSMHEKKNKCEIQ